MTHPLAFVCTAQLENGPRAIPNCHLWDMAQGIFEISISGEMSRGYFLHLSKRHPLCKLVPQEPEVSPFGAAGIRKYGG